MRASKSGVLKLTGIAAGAGAVLLAVYRKEIEAARQRVETDRQVIATPHGSIEFAESGNGPAVLMIHGAGGGFDQGLDLGRIFLGPQYRIIAPSRFGYLGTPLPADASAEAQAEAHLRLLDALQIESAPVIGVSAGAPSAMQLCLKHPDRCPVLALIVPLVYDPHRAQENNSPPAFFKAVLNTIAASDFLFWTATKVARSTLLKTILGTPEKAYRTATSGQRRSVDQMLSSILPISRRFDGIRNDSVVSSNLTRYPLEDIRVPTLVISAADDLYGTYESGFYTAEHIAESTFVGFPAGGHLLLGHDAQVRSQLSSFLDEYVQAHGKATRGVTDEIQLRARG